jgi:hypothetical protein
MKSPFPGMDPYLERHWGDVHTSLTTYARDQLNAQLPAGLLARVEEYVVVEADETGHLSIPDVRVIKGPEPGAPSISSTVTIALAEPLVMSIERQTLREVHIMDVTDRVRLVTSIEFLSPANKRSPAGRRQYEKKQWDVIDSGANLVEIDLLRAGAYVLAGPEDILPEAYRKPYRISVFRAGTANWEVYKASFREPLPAIRVPLRETDNDVGLNIQVLIDQAYASGRYSTIDYRKEPEPPFEPEDAAWADALLREKGRR